MFIRCDVCRRYVELMLTSDVAERQVRRTSFSCVACGGHGALTGDDPGRAARIPARPSRQSPPPSCRHGEDRRPASDGASVLDRGSAR
jgi:hypothetical protein